MKNRYLVVYDYGQGGLWAFIHAVSASQIVERFPELKVIDEIPTWMTKDLQSKIEQSDTYDLDAPPSGLLANILDDRDRVD